MANHRGFRRIHDDLCHSSCALVSVYDSLVGTLQRCSSSAKSRPSEGFEVTVRGNADIRSLEHGQRFAVSLRAIAGSVLRVYRAIPDCAQLAALREHDPLPL